jgi:formylglycine-generating enzyme required for sulfatase activity
VAFELQAGAVIGGKLRLLRPLGQGGMGVVWAARHETLETDVAVKLIRPERVAADPALITRFEREARTTARIAHPHVVHVMDYGTLDGVVPYIVMELLGGFSLAELLEKGGRLSLSTACVLVQQVGSALESAHERGVVHRDIKPHNVFILEESRGYPLFVKVLDFGIAKMLGDTQVPGGSHTLTETGTIVGSPPYMSPEQIEGMKNVDLRSDLWSLAVIVYESLTGEAPFRGGSFVAVGSAVLKGQYRPVSELRKGLPAAIDDWFAKALSVDPDARFQSAREMVEAFQEIERQREEESTRSQKAVESVAFATTLTAAPAVRTQSHAPLVEKRRLAPRRRVAAWSVLGVCLLAAGGGVFAFAGKGRSRNCPPGMKRVEGGTFRMGSPSDGETPSDESPQRQLALDPFCLDETEVSVGAYAECTSCKPLASDVRVEGLTPNAITFWSKFCNRADARDHPVNCIDWQGANEYCEAMGKRLPSEAEWELAARGESASTYPWGEAPPTGERVNACGIECSRMLSERGGLVEKKMYDDDDSAPATAGVGTHPAGATRAGVMDLAGNVWEWTSSHYCRYDEADCEDSRRVIRGGGWNSVESQDVRAARRLPSAPSARSWSVGFRCAKTP